MLICIVKSTGKLIEAQQGAKIGTLINNALRIGYRKEDIEEKEVTTQEFISLLRTPEVIAREEEQAQRIADINDSLPSWQQVSDAIDGVSTIAGMRVVIKKLARVVYWLAKNKGV